MKLCVLGSGSKGNAVYVEAGETRVLFDAGFSALEIKRRMTALGLDPAALTAVIVSHEHTDHVRGLLVLGRKVPVLATAGTLKAVRRRFEISRGERIEAGQWQELGPLRFLPVPTSHDAAEPVGFVVEDGCHRVAIVTDLGVVTRAVEHRLADLTYAVIEANHDPDLLMNGPYPWDVKQRVKGRLGHLANHEGAALAGHINRPGLKGVFLAHLSETNNRPDLALAEVRRALDGSGVSLAACRQDRPSAMIEV